MFGLVIGSSYDDKAIELARMLNECYDGVG